MTDETARFYPTILLRHIGRYESTLELKMPDGSGYARMYTSRSTAKAAAYTLADFFSIDVTEQNI